MNAKGLADLLRARYEAAPTGDKATAVVLFSIEYASALENHSAAEISALSGIGKWGPQIAFGRKLAAHVELSK